jgi:hypothetical protein
VYETAWPGAAGLSDEVTAVVVAARVTVSDVDAVEPVSSASPEYVAVIE